MAKAKKEQLSLEEKLELALVKEAEQPYKIPNNWLWVKYDKCLEKLESGRRPKGGVNGISEGIPSIGGEHLSYDGTFKFEKIKFVPHDFAKTIKSGIIEKNDTLLVKDGATIGKASFVDNSFPYDFALINEHVFKCKVNNVLDSKLGFYYIISNLGQNFIAENIRGAAQGGIITTFAENLFVPLPPLPEQTRIVTQIESLFTKLDSAKELVQSALDSFENRKSAILHKAFSGELTAKWREENGVGFDSWEDTKLKECGKWFGGGTPSKSKNEYWENGDILWITPKDMKYDLITNSIDKITLKSVLNSSANLIEKPSVLFVMRSGILRRILPISYSSEVLTINQDMKALVPVNQIDLKYIFYCCRSNEQFIRESCSKNGTTVESINSEALFQFSIPVPSLPEQTQIVRILDDLLESSQKARDLADIIDQIDLMKKSILARAFRGELGTNDSAEDSALELLKEVLADKK